jgi:hypothetical protein
MTPHPSAAADAPNHDLAAILHVLAEVLARLDRLEQLLNTRLVAAAPTSAPGPPHQSVGCGREIKETLRAVGHRLTTAEVLRELSRRGYQCADSTVKAALANLVDTDPEINNRQDVNPRGYGFREWDQAV